MVRALIPIAADEKVELLLVSDRPIDTSEFPVLGTVREIIAPGANSRLWSLFTFPKVCRREGADLAHVQYTVSPFLKVPVVTTIHDISFFIEPAWFEIKDRTLLRLSVPASIRRATKVIAVSETSRQEMIDILGVPPEKVVATPLGAPRLCSAPTPKRPNVLTPDSQPPAARRLPPTVLFVGGLQARKNWRTAIAAVASARGEWPELRLMITGRNRTEPQEFQQAIDQFHAKSWLDLPGGVSDQELAELYANAFCVIHPSLHEGFGLTPLEAFASGAPVIASNRGAIPEVVGDAAVLLDPDDVDSWARAILNFRDPATREGMIAKGRDRAQQFTWEKTAAKTMAVYKSACN